MKPILALGVLALGMVQTVYADQTCTVVGTQVYCTNGPSQQNWQSIINQMNQDASPEAAARAELARQQAALLKLQQELLRQQIEAAKAAAGK